MKQGGDAQTGRCQLLQRHAFGWWVVMTLNLAATIMPVTLALALSLGLAVTIVLMSLGLIRGLWKSQPNSILSPLGYLALVTGLFHGVGVLVIFIANDSTLNWVYSHHAVSTASLLKTNLVVALGLAVLWTGASMGAAMISGVERRRRRVAASPEWLARFFFFVGFGCLLGLVLPYMLGRTTGALPGVFMVAVNVAWASVFLMAMLREQNGKSAFRVLLPVAIVLGVVAGLISTSKTYVLLTLLFYFLGRFYVHRDFRRLAAGASVVLVTYATLTSVVVAVRTDLAATDDGTSGARLALYLDAISQESEDDGIEWSLLRLSYVAPEAFAIDAYDDGQPGNSIVDGMRLVLLPRLLFPDKPSVELGREFSAWYGGNPDNSVSPGIFAEAYLNGGWGAVVLVSLLAGLAIGASHGVVLESFQSQDWLLLPLCVGLFLEMGRINGFFSLTYVYGPLAILAIQGLLWMVVSVVKGGTADSRAMGRKTGFQG